MGLEMVEFTTLIFFLITTAVYIQPTINVVLTSVLLGIFKITLIVCVMILLLEVGEKILEKFSEKLYFKRRELFIRKFMSNTDYFERLDMTVDDKARVFLNVSNSINNYRRLKQLESKRMLKPFKIRNAKIRDVNNSYQEYIVSLIVNPYCIEGENFLVNKHFDRYIELVDKYIDKKENKYLIKDILYLTNKINILLDTREFDKKYSNDMIINIGFLRASRIVT